MSQAPPNARPVAELMVWLAGPAVWAVHFAVMYGAHALICARLDATGPSLLWPVVAASATALALLALAGLIVARVRRARSRARSNGQTMFARDLTIALAAVSMLGVVWVALPAVVTAPCG